MSIAAALLIFAQASAPFVAQAPAPQPTAIATVQASVRVLRPARISVAQAVADAPEGQQRDHSVQRGRDAAGTVWIEFS